MTVCRLAILLHCRKKGVEVRTASAIAIQTVWRKMKQYKRKAAKRKKGEPLRLDSKEVLVTLEALKQVRTAPIDFEQDFAARIETQVWETHRDIGNLAQEIKSEHEGLRKDVLKEMAVVQGRLSKAIVEELRKGRASPEFAETKAKGGSRKEAQKAGKKSAPTSKKKKKDSKSGDPFSAVAAAKKQSGKARSRRLSRD